MNKVMKLGWSLVLAAVAGVGAASATEAYADNGYGSANATYAREHGQHPAFRRMNRTQAYGASSPAR